MGIYINPVAPGLLNVSRVIHVTNWRDQFDHLGNEVKGMLTEFPPFEELKIEEGETLFILISNGDYMAAPVLTDEKEYICWQEQVTGDSPNMLISDILALAPGTQFHVC